jgi:1-acyl-sn-glycerol-3-phosphate acyltransferase
MNVSLHGFDGPLARATRAELERRGHQITSSAPCAVFFPGAPEQLEQLAADPAITRLVLRSSALAYGPDPKNPGRLTENRVSLLAPESRGQRWLLAEDLARRHPNAALLRFSHVLAREEDGLVLRQMSAGLATPVAGYDPNLQFISLDDAARAVACAVESGATGVFNASGGGCVPLKQAYRAAGASRFALPAPLARLFAKDDELAELIYNCTVDGGRAQRELGFTPRQSSVEALRDFAATRPGGNPGLLRENYDDWGLDEAYINAWTPWFTFLRKVYWRIECEGMEHVPATGKVLFVSNHRGFMPIDAVMHLFCFRHFARRTIRFLIIHSLVRKPHLTNFLIKLGGVIASFENARHLFEQDQMVGIFPEGIRGTFLPYKRAYKLRDFSRSAFIEMAIENQAPILPVAVVGHAEIFPIIGRIDWSYITREWGWPYFPIAPMFPLAPVPIPSKWHMRVLPPIGLGGLQPADPANPRLVKEFSRHVQALMQANIDDMLSRRRSIFFGRVLNGRPVLGEPFTWPRRRAVEGTA